MSLKENISAAINSDINAQISSDAATNISEEVNSHISLKALSLKESGEIVNVNNITYSTVHDNISMYNNFVADDYYASKSWVLSKKYLTKEDIGDIDITNNIEELLNNKADKNHNHDDRYYTKDNLDTWQTNLDLAFIDINDRLNNKANWDALNSKIDITELDSFKSEINTTIDNFSAELSTKANIYDLDNLVNFSTFNELNNYVYESCATKDEIPTKVSELINDNAYVTTTDLTKINKLIPNAATKDNQLADKNFVNSSISTATANFKGTTENLNELLDFNGDLNDYAFYKHVDESGNTVFDRYKYTNNQWEYEYSLNNSSFTSDQWASINSGITKNIVNHVVTFDSVHWATVAGINKNVYKYNQPKGDDDTNSSNSSAYFPEGIIMGGTAFSAGLVTRGITGVTTPNATTGACNKENLYINFDGDFNDYSYKSNRQVILQAAIPGTHYGSNLYQYAAARGDAVKDYCDSHYSNIQHTHSYSDLTNTPTIPTKLSELDNDTNYITSADITKELILSLLTDAETQEF